MTIASVLLLSVILRVTPAFSGEKYIIDGCLDLGFVSPHGYGANVAIALDIEHLSGFKPFAGVGFNVTGMAYSGGIEYAVNPRLLVLRSASSPRVSSDSH